MSQFAPEKRRRLLNASLHRFTLASADFALLAGLLTGCASVKAASPTSISATPLVAPVEPTKSPTAILTATETPAAIVKLDKPMTTEFSPTNIEAMPTTNEEMVRAGQLGEAVRQYWQETGLINPDGTVNKPEHVLAAKPDQWTIFTFPGDPSKGVPGGDQTLMAIYKESDIIRPSSVVDWPLQPTDLLFAVKDDIGNTTGILATEILYYEDANGKIGVEPVFFFVDISKISDPILPIFLGHAGKDGGISLPYIGVKSGEEGYIGLLHAFEDDKNRYLNEPMQADREAFALRVAETGNPQGMGNFWWSGGALVRF